MQVQNNPQIPNTVPNFKAIKSVKYQGLYKKHPELAQNLVDTFKTNKTAMDFCKKYDVDIVFDAYKHMMDAVASCAAIIFNNPAKTKFFGLISGKDSIVLHSYGKPYSQEESLQESTQNLVFHLMNQADDKNATGVLEGNIKYKEEEIQNYLNEQAEKVKAKKENENAKRVAQQSFEKEQASLDASIKDLINNSK